MIDYSSTYATSYMYPLLPLGYVWDVMLVWMKGDIENTVSVLQYCVLLLWFHNGRSSSYRSVNWIGLWSCLI